MSAPKTGMLLLVERLANGNTRRIPLEAAQAMIAAPGARYALIDASTNAAPKGVVLKRKGNTLVIDLGDEQVAQIDAFYQQPDAAFVPDATLGAGDAMSGTTITAASPLQQGSSTVVWSAGDAGGAGSTFNPALAGIGLGGLVLAAAGGGGGGGGGSSEEPEPPAANSRVIGKIVMGPVTAANGLTVIIYEADGKTVLGEAKVQADGSFALDVGDYVGVVIARVVDASSGADYLDEATGADKDLNARLFSMEVVTEPNSTVVVNINVLTTLAYYKALEAADGAPLTAGGVTAANRAIAELFGLESLQGIEVVPVNGGEFDGDDGYSAGEIYGALLAAFSGADVANGGDTQATIEQILAGLTIVDGKATLSQEAQAALIEGAREAGATLEGGIAGLVDTYAPEFEASRVTVSIAENSPAGQVVHTAEASDPSGVRYSLSGTDAARFSIDAATGAVTLTGQPDHEAKASYSFTVVATDAAGNRSNQAVTLEVGNLDEVAPTITSGAVATAIDENSGAGQVVYVATADDSADTSGGVTFSLKDAQFVTSRMMTALGAPSQPLFTIDATTGAVTLVGDPDYEERSGYAFIVVATDAAGHSTEQLVTLDVNNLDERAPTIVSSATAGTIDENTGANQAVYTAAATDFEDVSAGITYSLKPGGDAAAFTIDAATGVVTLVGNPDHEAQANYTFTVVATDGAGLSDEQEVTLAVGNVDESAPTITSGATATTIVENTGASQLVYTAQATDTGDTSTGITYSLQPGGDAAAFSIDAVTGAVTLTGNPDHEAQASYTFTVVATDGAGLSDAQVVTLAVGNVDESAPTIVSSATAATIAENTGPNQVVYTAQATDTGDTSTGITYSLQPGGDAAAFSIDAVTGAVTLLGNPDYESKAGYSFTVVATDGAGLSDAREVTLAIGNVDESAPTITSGATATTIAENTGPNQLVYTVQASDTGDVASGITYSLKPGGDAAAFSIDALTGAVTLPGNPNHEAQASYTFTVVATDGAGLSDEQVVTLAIGNVDESAPTIVSSATATTIAENTGPNQVVYTAQATDTGDTSTGITYSLKPGGDAAAFSINALTGAVTLVGNPDYESKAGYSFTVVATDGAGLSDEQAVTLAIGNVDESAPTITSAATATTIAENTGPGQVVYTAQASDTGDVASGITYSLQPGGDAAAFSINAVTGAVTLVGNPDYESKAGYTFTVVATDGAGLSDAQAVTLAVSNVDDAAPIILSPSVAPAIAENTAANQMVYLASATDGGDISGGITYSLKPGFDAAAFSIDAGTGAVTLLASPDYESKPSYTFIVVATDAAGLFDEQQVSLAVTNRDESAPTIVSGATATTIVENTGANQVVYTAQASDTGDVASGITYSLKPGGDAAAFSINPVTGAVTLGANPDYESKAGYTFTVVATDGAGLSGERTVSLAIGDADEIAPTIASMAATTAGGANGVLNAGDLMMLQYTFTEAVNVDTAGGAPRLQLLIGGTPVYANFAGGSGTNVLTFVHVVAAGQNDADGVSMPANPIDLSGATIRDAAGNDASTAFSATGNLPALVVDTQAPAVTAFSPADNATAVAVDGNIVLTFNETVQAGNGFIVIGNGSDVRSIAVNDPQVTISGNTVTVNPTTDLQAGTTYQVQVSGGALRDLAGNDHAGVQPGVLDFTTEAPPAVNVVFDLVQGVNSDHSGREFQSGVSYDIYIRVDSESWVLNTQSQPGWATWTGGANLGTDDRIILVGTGAPIAGRFGPVDALDTGAPAQDTYIAWQTAVSVHASGGNGWVYRYTARSLGSSSSFYNTDTRQLWTGHWEANPNEGESLGNVYLQAMPNGILTSQGLAGGGIPG